MPAGADAAADDEDAAAGDDEHERADGEAPLPRLSARALPRAVVADAGGHPRAPALAVAAFASRTGGGNAVVALDGRDAVATVPFERWSSDSAAEVSDRGRRACEGGVVCHTIGRVCARDRGSARAAPSRTM